jgi:hypothetical protein
MSPIRSENIFKTAKLSFHINLHGLIKTYLKRIISEGDNSKFLEGCLPLIMPLID